MRFLQFLFLMASAVSFPLQQSSLITLRTTAPPPSGGNIQPVIYRELILEEWGSNFELLQSWNVPCSLPGLSTESWTEGHLSPRYPWGDQVWFLCRNVPVNSSLATNPAPVRYMVLNEEGLLDFWVEEPLYPNGTNLLNVIPYFDEVQSLNVFYLLGGGTLGNGPSSPAKPAQARIRVDTGQGLPPDAQGALLSATTGITMNQLRILNNTLYGIGLYGSSTTSMPASYQVGSKGILPLAARNPSTMAPLVIPVLSLWTDPLNFHWWHTGLNRTGYLGYTETTSLQQYPLPPTASTGTLGGVTWSIATVRQEGINFTIYLTNTSHIVKNTLNGLQNRIPYEPVLQAPPGWKYLSAHARNPNVPSPSATATATATSTSSSTATSSASATSTSTSSTSASATPTATPSPTAQSTFTSSSTASASASSYPTSTSTASRNPQLSADPSPSNSPTSSPTSSLTPSTTPSNGTIPLPPNNNQAQTKPLTPGDQAGIGLGSIAAVCVAGLAIIHYSSTLKNLWTRQFGSSSKGMKKVSFRSPITSMDAPITISHNPQVLVQQRLEQLKDLQRQLSTREVNQMSEKHLMDRTKKEFGPVITGESV